MNLNNNLYVIETKVYKNDNIVKVYFQETFEKNGCFLDILYWATRYSLDEAIIKCKELNKKNLGLHCYVVRYAVE